jgi:hypothetical protein
MGEGDMSTDRELLELAAKAAGIVGEWRTLSNPNGGEYDGMWIRSEYTEWNPLTDDGDALRLAVTLGLTINPYADGLFVSRNENERVIAQVWEGDRYAATRRAIVSAAAAIGESTP